MLSSSSLSEASDCTSLRASFSFRFLTIVPSQWYKVDSFYVDLETNYCCRAAVLHFFLARNQGHDDINVLNILARAKTSLGKVTHGANYTILYIQVYTVYLRSVCTVPEPLGFFWNKHPTIHGATNRSSSSSLLSLLVTLLGHWCFNRCFNETQKDDCEKVENEPTYALLFASLLLPVVVIIITLEESQQPAVVGMVFGEPVRSNAHGSRR